MNIHKTLKILLCVFFYGFSSCTPQSQEHDHSHESNHTSHASEDEVIFSETQFEALSMHVDTMPAKIMKGFVETNGQLILPPQSQAAVTAVVGANIQSVQVIEGNKVNKGQALAYLFHPDIIRLQTEYTTSINQLEYLEQSYQRQEKLYAESVTAGKDFQRVKADYLSKKSLVNGLVAQLKQLGVNPEKVKEGYIYETVALVAPITGFIQSVNVRTGQYVSPQEVMFEIIKTDHIHAHFKIFESDVLKVKEGQIVQFRVESQPEVQREATVFAVGKVFEQGSKAVNLHAELKNDDGSLLPGMYASGRIITEGIPTSALPKDAVVVEGGRHFIFQAEYLKRSDQWHFHPHEVSIGMEDGEWVEIKMHEKPVSGMRFAWNNAYYLMAELKKEEAGHDH